MRRDADRDGWRCATYGCDGGNDMGSLPWGRSRKGGFTLGPGCGGQLLAGELRRGLVHGCRPGTRDPDREDAYRRQDEKSGASLARARQAYALRRDRVAVEGTARPDLGRVRLIS